MAKFASVDEYLASLAEPLRQVGELVRGLIDAELSHATGALWHGHPVWSLGPAPGKAPVCFLKAYSSYVTFGFWHGQELDGGTRLTPGAQGMASVKLRSLGDIDATLFASWLRQAEGLSPQR